MSICVYLYFLELKIRLKSEFTLLLWTYISFINQNQNNKYVYRWKIRPVLHGKNLMSILYVTRYFYKIIWT